MKRLLIIEDNAELAFGLRNNLEIEGYQVDVATDGAHGLQSVFEFKPDLLILDLMLPSLDGLRILRAVRDSAIDMPVIVLTAKGEESNKVTALKMGADDYMTKPFGVLELLARVEAHLRRASRPAPRTESFGDITVDFGSRTVTKGGQKVTTSRKEFDLLAALLARPNTVISRVELMRVVWGYSDAVISRTVDTHIAELRRKLESNPKTPEHIMTVPTIGYRLDR